MYLVIFSKTAERQLKSLERPVQERIIAVLERVCVKPESYAAKLSGNYGYKVRAGDYRAIIDIDHQAQRITVTKIGHRKNVYERL